VQTLTIQQQLVALRFVALSREEICLVTDEEKEWAAANGGPFSCTTKRCVLSLSMKSEESPHRTARPAAGEREYDNQLVRRVIG